MATSNIHLKVTRADGTSEELSFDLDSIILGSGASANVQLEDDKVSSIHAMLKIEDGTVKVIDLGSESGTRVGGKEVREEDVSSGDVVELGGCKVEVTFGDESKQSKGKSKKKGAPPPPPAEALADDEAVAAANRQAKAIGASDSASRLFSEVIPPDERPKPDEKMLEVVMVWSDTVIGVGHFQPGDGVVYVGDGAKNRFNLSDDSIPGSRFPLVTPQGKDFAVTVAEGMKLKVREESGRTTDLDQLKNSNKAIRADAQFKGYTYKLDLNDQAAVTIGDTTFVIRYVRPSRRIVTNVWEHIDFYFTKVLATSFVAQLMFVIALLMTPIHTEMLSEDLFANPNRFAKLIIKPPEKEVKQKFEDLSKKEEKPKEEAKFGKKEEIKPEETEKKGAPAIDVDKREQDKKKVMKTGLLAALNKSDSGADSNIFGGGGLGTGINNALGGLQEAGAGDAMGAGGLGSRGLGPGGGGMGLGIGGIGTRGGRGGGGGGMGVNLGGRGKKKTRITSGTTIVQGGLEKEVIARIVRRHQNEIKYCYERELTKNPNLYGKVSIMWVIDATGNVATASVAETTMGNTNVENCLLTRVRRWKFPPPKGGGVVQVTYPWVFKPSN